MRSPRWTAEEAWEWYRRQPWLVGCNFLPSSAINQLEMFQPADYDRNRVVLERELGWASALGMNSLRVFLHDLLWKTDAGGFFERLDDFLGLCATRRIRPMLVIFDSCHRPEPQPGIQPHPVPGKHNPGWAQSPAVSVLHDESQRPELRRYVHAVLSRFGGDERILLWDLFNEPCHSGFDQNESKAPAAASLVRDVFEWAHDVRPSQPLTVGIWNAVNPLAPHDPDHLTDYQRILICSQQIAVEESDIFSFHHYSGPESLLEWIDRLSILGRPLVCTEYMARTAGSRFQEALPIFHARRIGAYNWGFVSGKSQTIFPWGSPDGAHEPPIWFHDILRPDGTPFDAGEVKLFQSLTQRRREAPIF